MTTLHNKTGIIFALDLLGREEAFRLAARLNDYIDAVKVSYPSIIHYGGDFMFKLSGRITVPIIADFKVADIPDMTRRIVKAAAANGAGGITIHGFAGENSVAAGIEETADDGIISFVVAGMSHSKSLYTIDQSIRILKMVKGMAYVDGVVLPATNPKLIARGRKLLGPNTLIMSPGVGFQGAFPHEAIKAGANYLVIGHSIYESPDPIKEAKRFAEIILHARGM